jgi:hypothetical protein
MNKQVLIGGFVGGIALFLLGWLFYGMLLVDTFAELQGSATGVEKEEMDLPLLFVGNLFSGLLLSYVFGNWANISTAAGGLKGGAIIGFFTGASFDLIIYSTTNLMSLKGAMLDVVVWVVMTAIAGAIVGMVMGKLK